MMKFENTREWWLGTHKNMLSWVLDNEGKITIADVVGALSDYPQSRLSLFDEKSGRITFIGKAPSK